MENCTESSLIELPATELFQSLGYDQSWNYFKCG